MAKRDDTEEARGLKGHNLNEVKKTISTKFKEMRKLIDERQSINDALGSIRAELQAVGIPRRALAAAMSHYELDADERDAFDAAYEIVREAIGDPFQPDLPLQVPGDED